MGPLLSDDKRNHLSHVIAQTLETATDAKLCGDSVQALKEIKRIIADQMKLEQSIDQFVRSRLASYSRQIVEGSSEWDVLYQKTYAQELQNRKLG